MIKTISDKEMNIYNICCNPKSPSDFAIRDFWLERIAIREENEKLPKGFHACYSACNGDYLNTWEITNLIPDENFSRKIIFQTALDGIPPNNQELANNNFSDWLNFAYSNLKNASPFDTPYDKPVELNLIFKTVNAYPDACFERAKIIQSLIKSAGLIAPDNNLFTGIAIEKIKDISDMTFISLKESHLFKKVIS